MLRAGGAARSWRVCGFSRADCDGLSWLGRPLPNSPRAGLCRADQLWPVYLTCIGCDAFRALVAIAAALVIDRAKCAADHARHSYAPGCHVLLATARTTVEPFSRREDACRFHGTERRSGSWPTPSLPS